MKKKREEHTIGKESEATEMMKGLEGEREKGDVASGREREFGFGIDREEGYAVALSC
jgi:hypothetical protein